MILQLIASEISRQIEVGRYFDKEIEAYTNDGIFTGEVMAYPFYTYGASDPDTGYKGEANGFSTFYVRNAEFWSFESESSEVLTSEQVSELEIKLHKLSTL